MTNTVSEPDPQQIFDILKSILIKEFEIPEEKITLEARLLEDFDIDSIDAVDMIVQLKPYLGQHRLTPEAFKSVRTLGDVVNVIASVLTQPEA